MAGADVFLGLGVQMPGPGIFTSPPPKSATIIEARVEYQAIGTTYPTDIATLGPRPLVMVSHGNIKLDAVI